MCRYYYICTIGYVKYNVINKMRSLSLSLSLGSVTYAGFSMISLPCAEFAREICQRQLCVQPQRHLNFLSFIRVARITFAFMQPDRYETSSTGRSRLSGNLQKRGSKLGMSNWGGFLFGGVFVAVGTWIILVGTKVVAVNPTSVHAPYWVLTVAGASFALGGFIVWSMTWKQFAIDRSRREAARQHPDEPALADYPWHPDGFTVSEWTSATKTIAAAIGLSVFLSMFNWWAFGINGPWMIKGIVGLFDIITVLVWVKAVQQVLGASQVRSFTRGVRPVSLPVAGTGRSSLETGRWHQPHKSGHVHPPLCGGMDGKQR